MRWFAWYLPQFHETEENNKWWGKGFTEWTHVNAAKPLFKGHLQPIVPLDNRYYNLMDKETVQWQTSLMKQYGIDGMVYYHYYFTGKMLLNKPAENLLQWTDIDQPFFFCWANHTWYQAIDGVKTVLMEQTYGTQEDWEKHFQYLLPFFRDSRYEKKDNKPLFMIYVCNYPEKKEMIDYFDRRCKESGFDGIYTIETYGRTYKPEDLDAFRENKCAQTGKICVREPSVAITNILLSSWYQFQDYFTRKIRKIIEILFFKGHPFRVVKYSGEKLYRAMLDSPLEGEDLCRGVFFSWDNTPRHKRRGYIITPPSKESFLRYADKIKDDEYAFINAWNEWAEGMILEPTTHDGYKYLEWIKEWNDKNR